MVEDHDFPTQFAEEADGCPLRWAVSVITLTALALALFNAGAIAAWVEDMQPGPGTTHAVVAAESWESTTARLGFGIVYTDLHQMWKHLESARWSDRKYR